MSLSFSRAFAALTLVTALGCSQDTGSVNVTIWGEEFIETQIGPAQNADDEGGFQNNWTLTFNRFLIHVSDVTVNNTAEGSAGALPMGRVYDLHNTRGSGTPVGAIANVAVGRADQVAFRINPATMASVAGNASDADLGFMRMNGYSVYFEASATRPGLATPITLRWGFTAATRFSECVGEANQPGVVVAAGAAAAAQITIHGDHFFYDSLSGETDMNGNSLTRLRFDAIANADANRDNVVTLDELAAVDLTTLPANQYRAGNIPNVVTLRDFVAYQTRSLGHFNGEGECRTTPL
ncbi:MAG: hypothetical protein JNK72_03170 [Myxococcales bacterium]|nr:hypothetical protein [Myxococcales bacterium]